MWWWHRGDANLKLALKWDSFGNGMGRLVCPESGGPDSMRWQWSREEVILGLKLGRVRKEWDKTFWKTVFIGQYRIHADRDCWVFLMFVRYHMVTVIEIQNKALKPRAKQLNKLLLFFFFFFSSSRCLMWTLKCHIYSQWLLLSSSPKITSLLPRIQSQILSYHQNYSMIYLMKI